jgi:hypothetical protein
LTKLQRDRVSQKEAGRAEIDALLISNFIPLAKKTFFMLLPHVSVQFITTKVTLSTKFA